MEIVKNYTPENIKFIAANENDSEMPAELFAECENENQKFEMLKDNFGHVWSKSMRVIEVDRELDGYEISSLREEYQQELEETLPTREYELAMKEMEVKKEIGDMKALVNASYTKIKDLSSQVAKGTVKMSLSGDATHRIANYDLKKFFFYSFVNGRLLLVKIEQIPDEECTKWYNAMPTLSKHSVN